MQGHVPAPSVAEACRPVIFRDVRDAQGKLQFLNQRDRVRVIADMPLVNTVTGAALNVRDLNLG